MLIGMYVDEIGSSNTPEEEYGEIQQLLQKIFPEAIFRQNVLPTELSVSYDIYVFDSGGLSMRFPNSIKEWQRLLVSKIKDQPNTFFIIWSTLSQIYLEDILPDLKNLPNVLVSPSKLMKIKDFFKNCLTISE